MESLALTFGRGVAQALSKTHSRLVYHSDIKMGNCIIMTEVGNMACKQAEVCRMCSAAAFIGVSRLQLGPW